MRSCVGFDALAGLGITSQKSTLQGSTPLPPAFVHLTWIDSVWLEEYLGAVVTFDDLNTKKHVQRETAFFK
jgi:hypothetical protein